MMPESEVTRKLAHLEAQKTGAAVFLVTFAVVVCSMQVWLAFQIGGQSEELRRVARQTHNSLCAFKMDLAERQRQSVQFVIDVRKGRRPPIEGITTAELDQAIANRQATLDSLRSLDCS